MSVRLIELDIPEKCKDCPFHQEERHHAQGGDEYSYRCTHPNSKQKDWDWWIGNEGWCNIYEPTSEEYKQYWINKEKARKEAITEHKRLVAKYGRDNFSIRVADVFDKALTDFANGFSKEMDKMLLEDDDFKKTIGYKVGRKKRRNK